MKIDTYSKVILTGIAIFLGFIAFDYKPSIKAEAGLMGGNEMIAPEDGGALWHLKDGKIRWCRLVKDTQKTKDVYVPHCYPFSDGQVKGL
jgi:4-amino-4-deoxy-L-arabinose transferase-like glycosyltransferase